VAINVTNGGGETSRLLLTSVVGAESCKMQSELDRTVLQKWNRYIGGSHEVSPIISTEMMLITKEMKKYRR
jgi:hypothetical protein